MRTLPKMQVGPQTLEQPSSSAEPAQQQTPATGSASISSAQPQRTPQQSPKHGLSATSPSRLTTPPQTIDRHASVDASSPVSAASSAGLNSSQDIASGQSLCTLCMLLDHPVYSGGSAVMISEKSRKRTAHITSLEMRNMQMISLSSLSV